ncbi:sigma 54-interacting transcriptional regulator [Paenactinomyces guangxiensis]|uniref:HTH-type transcriptional regulatory protein TyrR n=2 Tax=Paenactinomyces guangxiensis TaxID=1490290 RepID=A0A7W2A8P5_9BACL|nr:sigma 54-interacting transcriptional regulator [Paenactinomyces guangxiensis]MBH8591212.1 sigma 54-interacting transcriptional regulator [Paenactinomyces guangxiensis]
MNETQLDPELWKSIFFSLHNGVIVMDKNRKILSINPSAKKLLQIENENWVGKEIKVLIPETKLPETLTEGYSSIGQKMMIASRQCIVNRTPLYQNGKRIGAIGVIQDISEMEYYRNLSKQMESIIEFSTDGVYVVNSAGITIFVNSAYEEITGLHRDQLIGNHMSKLMEKGFIDQSVSLLVLQQKKRISIIQTIKGKKDVIVTGNPVFDEAGEIEMVVTSVRDITHLNQMKLELEKAKSFSHMANHRYTFQTENANQTIVFRSPRMKEVYGKIQQVAPFPTSILLTGQTGVGKEVIANLIHNLSDRKEKPFIKINCGAIPEQLLESELFGYEPGAFTGAKQDGKIGLLELANGGTVMLDEIGEMPLLLQVKLLRVLQEKQIYRIGGTTPRNLDIRFISATNQELTQLINKGRFREDLYYRLKVVEIHIPPLTEREEDIEELIHYFFSYYCDLYHIEKQLAKETVAILKTYSWPGNVRELRNLMENMVVSIPTAIIEPHHLPLHIYDHHHASPETPFTLKQRLEQFEKRMVKEALQKNKSIRKASQQLGIDHSTLVKKIKKWNMNTDNSC